MLDICRAVASNPTVHLDLVADTATKKFVDGDFEVAACDCQFSGLSEYQLVKKTHLSDPTEQCQYLRELT